MNLLELPWSGGVLFVIFIFFLAVRELVLACETPPHLPERGIGFFHSVILFIVTVLLAVGMGGLFAHMKQLESLVPLYPVSRYAPEREAFAEKDTWVFVTKMKTHDVHAYYEEVAKRLGYTFASNSSAGTERLLLSHGNKNIFLTIEDEGRLRALYYSEKGKVETVTVK